MKSMTGYGTAKSQCSTAEIEVNVRSVNGRFLELRVHLPREFFALESEVRKLVGQYIQRGSVDVFVSRRRGAGSRSMVVKTAPDLAKKWVKGFNEIKKATGLKDSPSMAMMLKVPELIHIEEESHFNDQEGKLFIKTLKESLVACDRERRREGQALKKILRASLAQLHQITQDINKSRNEAGRRIRERYQQRLEKLSIPHETDSQRIAQEIAIQIDKAEINEEIDRLGEHIRVWKSMLNAPGHQGKKMDFYTQELLREINTIGSKAQWAVITHQVVEGKAIIEKLREQVQNIE